MLTIVDAFRSRLQREEPLPIGQRIALERTLAGLGVAHCARAMGWQRMMWQRVEADRRELDDLEIARIATVLGITSARLRGLQATVTPGHRRSGRPPARRRRVTRSVAPAPAAAA